MFKFPSLASTDVLYLKEVLRMYIQPEIVIYVLILPTLNKAKVIEKCLENGLFLVFCFLWVD